jgi:hypothetical protein
MYTVRTEYDVEDRRGAYGVLGGNLRESDHLENVGVDGG